MQQNKLIGLGMILIMMLCVVSISVVALDTSSKDPFEKDTSILERTDTALSSKDYPAIVKNINIILLDKTNGAFAKVLADKEAFAALVKDPAAITKVIGNPEAFAALVKDTAAITKVIADKDAFAAVIKDEKAFPAVVADDKARAAAQAQLNTGDGWKTSFIDEAGFKKAGLFLTASCGVTTVITAALPAGFKLENIGDDKSKRSTLTVGSTVIADNVGSGTITGISHDSTGFHLTLYSDPKIPSGKAPIITIPSDGKTGVTFAQDGTFTTTGDVTVMTDKITPSNVILPAGSKGVSVEQIGSKLTITGTMGGDKPVDLLNFNIPASSNFKLTVDSSKEAPGRTIDLYNSNKFNSNKFDDTNKYYSLKDSTTDHPVVKIEHSDADKNKLSVSIGSVKYDYSRSANLPIMSSTLSTDNGRNTFATEIPTQKNADGAAKVTPVEPVKVIITNGDKQLAKANIYGGKLSVDNTLALKNEVMLGVFGYFTGDSTQSIINRNFVYGKADVYLGPNDKPVAYIKRGTDIVAYANAQGEGYMVCNNPGTGANAAVIVIPNSDKTNTALKSAGGRVQYDFHPSGTPAEAVSKRSTDNIALEYPVETTGVNKHDAQTNLGISVTAAATDKTSTAQVKVETPAMNHDQTIIPLSTGTLTVTIGSVTPAKSQPGPATVDSGSETAPIPVPAEIQPYVPDDEVFAAGAVIKSTVGKDGASVVTAQSLKTGDNPSARDVTITADATTTTIGPAAAAEEKEATDTASASAPSSSRGSPSTVSRGKDGKTTIVPSPPTPRGQTTAEVIGSKVSPGQIPSEVNNDVNYASYPIDTKAAANYPTANQPPNPNPGSVRDTSKAIGGTVPTGIPAEVSASIYSASQTPSTNAASSTAALTPEDSSSTISVTSSQVVTTTVSYPSRGLDFTKTQEGYSTEAVSAPKQTQAGTETSRAIGAPLSTASTTKTGKMLSKPFYTPAPTAFEGSLNAVTGGGYDSNQQMQNAYPANPVVVKPKVVVKQRTGTAKPPTSKKAPAATTRSNNLVPFPNLNSGSTTNNNPLNSGYPVGYPGLNP